MRAPKELITIVTSRFPAQFAYLPINRSDQRLSLGFRKTRCSRSCVLDPTKPQAPVWRENFEGPVGRKPARCAAAGKAGLPRACLARSVPCWDNVHLRGAQAFSQLSPTGHNTPIL